MAMMIDLTIESKPVSVKFECPECCWEHEIDYKKFDENQTGEWWGEWSDPIECENCNMILKINDVDYD